ncbi:MAG: hypothetical protein Q7S13_00700 [Candidatus Omnitrophota bacterium]|nr:hypothetical protein [Candidatus Omnitrophota bacterium]
MFFYKRKSGQSLIEFTVLVMFILGAFLVFQKYIVRGFAGRWKSVGESFSQGKVYDPAKTIECAFDQKYNTLQWYDQKCFQENCIKACYTVQGSDPECKLCIESCEGGINGDMCNG